MLIQTTSFLGLFGLGMLIVLVNMIWSQAFLAKNRKLARLLAVLGAVLLVSIAVHGQLTINKFERHAPVPETTVAIAQPNVDLRLKWDPAFTDSTFRLIERFCREADNSFAEIVVFPETCAPVYIRYKPNYMNRLSLLAEELDLAIYIGFLDGRYEGPNDSLWVYNSCAVFDTSHVFVQYDKTHLLPFGEAIPFAWKYPSFGGLDFGQANFHPGPARPPAPSRAGAIGPMICFESIFPDIARDHAKRGAELLFNITNDGWFGITPGPYQHNEMAILRAVENHRYLVRSSNTGISMFVDPVGRVVSSLGLNVEGILIDSVRPIQRTTFYTRYGDTPVLIAALLMIVSGTLLARRKTAEGSE
jgi:apolipoprotein N-acyltransferase